MISPHATNTGKWLYHRVFRVLTNAIFLRTIGGRIMYNEVIKKLLHKIEILPENLVVMYLMKAYGLSENMARQAVYSACRNRTCYKKGDYLARLPYIETDSSLMKKAAAFRLVIEFLPDSQDFNVGYSPWLVSFLRGNNLVQVCYIERNMELVSSMMIAEKAVPKDERASIKRIAIIENGSDIAKVKSAGFLVRIKIDGKLYFHRASHLTLTIFLSQL